MVCRLLPPNHLFDFNRFNRTSTEGKFSDVFPTEKLLLFLFSRWVAVCLCIHWVVQNTKQNHPFLIHASSVIVTLPAFFFFFFFRPLLSSAVSVPGTFACLIMPPCIEIPGETFWSRKMNWNDWNGIFFPALPYLISNKIKEESCDGQKSKLHPYNKHSVTYK